jgi:L-lactate dehydrogenase complex protein LldG
MTAKDVIRGRIRNALELAHREVPELPRPLDTGPSPGTPSGLDDTESCVQRFREMLESVGGFCYLVRDEAEAQSVLARVAAERSAERIAVSDQPFARRLAGSLTDHLIESDQRAALLEADIGVTTAQWAIAETGTIVLESDSERNRLVSLLPPVHVAILDASVILSTLGALLSAVQRGKQGGPPPAITLITGPSRTADIELTLVVGVHGPRELHVILLRTDLP